MLRNLKSRLFHTGIVMSAHYSLHNEKPQLKIMTPKETIAFIRKHNCSVARFGDGEFEMVLEAERKSEKGISGFQKRNPVLIARLKEVLASEDPNLLVCIPYALNSLWGRTKDSRNFWFYWGERDNQRSRITSLIRSYHGADKIFGDSQISRPYIAWKSKRNADYMFPQIKKLWKSRDVLIVEGEKTRLGVGNDLFAEATSIKRILAPATNAFDHLEDIRKQVTAVHTNELVIMALGPTATVLAAELSAMHIQAIDIGHVDIEYEWYLSGAKKQGSVAGKFTNEVSQGACVEECQDVQYQSQIIARV